MPNNVELKLPDWRSDELSYDEILEKYPTVSPFVILKADILRRGFILTEIAKEHFDDSVYINAINNSEKDFGAVITSESKAPVGLILRDGTAIGCSTNQNEGIRDPYVIDYDNGKFVITDLGKTVEDVDFWRKPDYYGKYTSKGNLMESVLTARPRRLDVFSANKYCNFWGRGEGCKFCSLGPAARFYRNNPEAALADPDEIEEAVVEALKQKGRFTTICTTAGSITSGDKLFDDEVKMYSEIYSRIRRHFKGDELRFQYVASAFDKEQLIRLKEATGNIAFTTNLEVPTAELFEWICPGKAKDVGFEGWKQRLYDAVEVLGKGNVNTQIVAGADLVQPNGFKTEDESVDAILKLTEELAQHDVGVVANVWGVVSTIIFKNFYPPSLEYYTKVFSGINDIQQKYDILTYFDDYKRCGTHPSSDLLRD